MTRQGLCLDATQAPVNILDRLEGLSKVVPPEVMEQALSETGMSRATILQTVAPSDALDCIGHGLAHAPADSPGLQACVLNAAQRKDAFSQQPQTS